MTHRNNYFYGYKHSAFRTGAHIIIPSKCTEQIWSFSPCMFAIYKPTLVLLFFFFNYYYCYCCHFKHCRHRNMGAVLCCVLGSRLQTLRSQLGNRERAVLTEGCYEVKIQSQVNKRKQYSNQTHAQDFDTFKKSS